MKGSRILTICVLLIGGGLLASAEPITYTESATGSGSLGGSAFTDQLITLTAAGDTTNVFLDGSIWRNDVTVLLTVAGLGSATFTDAMEVFDNPGFAPPAAGFAATFIGSVLDTFDNSFGSYDLKTDFGPVTGANFINAGTSFHTTAGNFVINSAGNSTFTASTVPEPSSVGLLGFGIGAIALRLRRKK